jgi:CRP-like cAMP-binding protein
VRRNGGRIAVLGPGQFFGELSIIHPAPRTATVSVYEAATLLVLEGYDFRSALTTNTAMAHHLIRVLAERLRALTDDYSPRVR